MKKRMLLLGAGALALALAVGVGALVRAAPPDGHFTVTTDTVTDNHTGLIWQRTISTSGFTHAGAIGYCSGLVLAGSSEWRLPEVGELQTILDETRVNPAIDTSVFPSTPESIFRSSSAFAGDAGGNDGGVAWNVYFVNFTGGHVGDVAAGATSRVRCVR